MDVFLYQLSFETVVQRRRKVTLLVCPFLVCVYMSAHVFCVCDCSCEMLAEMLWTLRQMLRQHEFLHQQVAANLSGTPAIPNQSLATQMHKFATAQLQTLVKRWATACP